MVQVTAPGRFGGLESVVALLATGLAGRGHRVRVVAFLGVDPSERCEAFDGIAAAGAELVEIRLPGRSYPQERRRLQAVLEARSIAHSHGYHADLITGWAVRGSRTPAVSTAHGFTGRGWKNRMYEWLDRRAVRGFSGVIAVSGPLEADLARAGVPGERLHRVPNAFRASTELLSREEARQALGLPAEGPMVGWIGRLTDEKGPDVFLQAMSHLPATVGASVLGDGPMRPGLEAWAGRQLGAGRIRWHGGLPRASRYFAAFDVVALTSWTEGTPIVLFEAMNAGVPVVVTAVGGVPDVVGPAEAILVPAGDAGAIARGIERVLDQPNEAATRAAAARARLTREYSIEPWLDRHESIYRGLACR